jgi:hypothetical protein
MAAASRIAAADSGITRKAPRQLRLDGRRCGKRLVTSSCYSITRVGMRAEGYAHELDELALQPDRTIAPASTFG